MSQTELEDANVAHHVVPDPEMRPQSRLRTWLLQGLVDQSGRYQGSYGVKAEKTHFVVARHVPHRRRLLLDPRVPARHRRARRRVAVAPRHDRAGAADPLRSAAGVPPCRPRELQRRGLDRDAREAAALVGRQAVRAGAAGLRGDRLHDHDHALCRRCDSARHREPLRTLVVPRQRGDHHPRARRAARRGLRPGVPARRSASRPCSSRSTSHSTSSWC